MSQSIVLSRRALIGTGVSLVAARAIGAVPTSAQELGPFYPVIRPLEQDADLTRVKNGKGIASGQVIDVFGRVTDAAGRPVPQARLDIWQANALGRYDHPGDARDVPLDPNFQGSAIIVADADGNYRFRTIKPGAYPIPGDRVRPPHIHFDVTGRKERLTTQMYFAGDPLNEKDFIFAVANPKSSVLAKSVGAVTPEPGAVGWQWDIVLAVG